MRRAQISRGPRRGVGVTGVALLHERRDSGMHTPQNTAQTYCMKVELHWYTGFTRPICCIVAQSRFVTKFRHGGGDGDGGRAAGEGGGGGGGGEGEGGGRVGSAGWLTRPGAGGENVRTPES